MIINFIISLFNVNKMLTLNKLIIKRIEYEGLKKFTLK